MSLRELNTSPRGTHLQSTTNGLHPEPVTMQPELLESASFPKEWDAHSHVDIGEWVA